MISIFWWEDGKLRGINDFIVITVGYDEGTNLLKNKFPNLFNSMRCNFFSSFSKDS